MSVCVCVNCHHNLGLCTVVFPERCDSSDNFIRIKARINEVACYVVHLDTRSELSVNNPRRRCPEGRNEDKIQRLETCF